MENIFISNKPLSSKRINDLYELHNYSIGDTVAFRNSNSNRLTGLILGNKIQETGMLWWKKHELVWKIEAEVLEVRRDNTGKITSELEYKKVFDVKTDDLLYKVENK